MMANCSRSMLEVAGEVASIMYIAFILPQQVPTPISGLGLDRVRRTTVAKENCAVAPSIGGPSLVVMMGRIIIVTERPKVNPFAAV